MLIFGIKPAPFIQPSAALAAVAGFANHNHIIRYVLSAATARENMLYSQTRLNSAINTFVGLLFFFQPFPDRR